MSRIESSGVRVKGLYSRGHNVDRVLGFRYLACGIRFHTLGFQVHDSGLSSYGLEHRVRGYLFWMQRFEFRDTISHFRG